MWPLVRRRYILPILLLFAHGCDCWYSADRPDPPTSSVTTLRVVPSTVFVVPGALFVMRARILDGEGGILPSHPALEWIAQTGLSLVSHAADSAVVQATTPTSGTP